MITNTTKGKILVKKNKICVSSWSQAKGLMFARKQIDFGLIFEFKKLKKTSLHMIFVFYPIDVLFLDENKRVVDLKEDFKPFGFYNSKKRVKYVIELPLYTIKFSNTSINDIIDF
ncbi:DUF192 domain-containing protein [Candidatus Woesearchaeota archaeon]|nr:DUF192 domain-containing protein [Candidatus Woesearchaeota archaeon]